MSEDVRYTSMNAEELLVKWLNGDCTADEVRELGKHYDIAELEAMTAATRRVSYHVVDPAQQWQQLQNRIQTPAKAPAQSSRRGLAKWLLLGLIALVGGYFVGQHLMTDSRKVIVNDQQAPLHMALEDGTEIDLAPGGQLSYVPATFGKDRVIELSGHAYFDVQKKGPFAVHVDGVTVSVLGTSFDIWPQGGSKVQVQCYTGSVSVSNGSNSKVLQPGQYCTAYQEGIRQGKGSIDDKPSWITGIGTFDNVSLAAVHAELAAYYGVVFSEVPASAMFTGQLPLNDIDKALKVLSGVTNSTYQLQGDQVIITSD